MTTETKDRTVTCTECKKQFVFSEGEQTFFAIKGLMNVPKRCADCRVLMRAFRNGLSGTTAEATCTKCGATCRVPFIPKGHRPIYCTECRHRGDVASLQTPEIAG